MMFLSFCRQSVTSNHQLGSINRSLEVLIVDIRHGITLPSKGFWCATLCRRFDYFTTWSFCQRKRTVICEWCPNFRCWQSVTLNHHWNPSVGGWSWVDGLSRRIGFTFTRLGLLNRHALPARVLFHLLQYLSNKRTEGQWRLQFSCGHWLTSVMGAGTGVLVILSISFDTAARLRVITIMRIRQIPGLRSRIESFFGVDI